MESRSLSFCGRFLLGADALAMTGEFLRELGVEERKAVFVVDSVTWRIAGERLSGLLTEAGFTETRPVLVEKGAVREEVERAREKIRALKPCIVFGVGGGVNIDIAKASAFLEKMRWIVVPTIFAADAMTGVNATFRAEKIGVDGREHDGDYDIRVGPPLACIVDTEIVTGAPWRFQAAGFADYVAKRCAIEDWRLAHSLGKDPDYSEYAVLLAASQTEYLLKNAARIRRREGEPFRAFMQAMMNDGFLSQMAGSSRILFGSEHVVAQAFMEEQISSGTKGLHGEQVAIGTILMAGLQGLDWMTLRRALLEIGAPVSARQIGLSEASVIRSLGRARSINESWLRERSDIYTVLMERSLDDQSATRLAKETMVI